MHGKTTLTAVYFIPFQDIIRDWTIDDVVKWLVAINLHKYVDLFKSKLSNRNTKDLHLGKPFYSQYK